MTENRKQQQKLIDIYEKLPPVTKEIVQVSAVVEPLSRTNLVNLAAKAGVRHADGRALNFSRDRNAIDATIDKGVLAFESKKNKGRVKPAVLVFDYVFRQAYTNGLADRVREQIDGDPKSRRHLVGYGLDPKKVARDMRFAFYSGDWNRWNELMRRTSFRPYVLDPFCQTTFASLSENFQADFLAHVSRTIVNTPDPRRAEFAASVASLIEQVNPTSDDTIAAATNLLTAQGNTAALESLASRVNAPSEALGCASFLRGDFAAAQQHFETADQKQRKATKKRTTNLAPFPMLLYAILLLKQNTSESLKHAKQIIKTINRREDIWHLAGIPLEKALAHQLNPMKSQRQMLPQAEDTSSLGLLFSGWVWSWHFREQASPLKMKICEELCVSYRDGQLSWIAAEFAALASRLSTSDAKSKKFASQSQKLHEQLGTVSLIDLIEPAPLWESGLMALANFGQSTNTVAVAAPLADERMIWELNFGANWLNVTPYIQKLKSKGWTKGRKVGLGRLYEQWQTDSFDFLTDQDQQICRTLREHSDRNYYGYHETSYQFSHSKLLPALLDHPHLYLPGERDEPVQLSKMQPHLTIKQTETGIRLAVEPKLTNDESEVRIVREGSHRFSIVQFSNKQLDVAALVKSMPSIPIDQQKRVFEIAQSLSPIIDIQSNMQGAPSTGEEKTASAQIVAQLTPYHEGLRVELFTHPLGEEGPFCRPGFGEPAMLATIKGQTFTTNRDLDAERKNLTDLFEVCPVLESRTVSDDQVEWLFADSDDALEAVVELKGQADQNKIKLLWPRGKTHDVAGSSSASNFQVSLRRDRDWFAASGKLNVNDDLALDLMKLLDLASTSPSRFVRLDDGRYLALTRDLRQRIADIAAFGTLTKNKIRFAPVRAMVVDELFDEAGLKTDKHWKSHLAQIVKAGEVCTKVPSTLQAELRDYQLEGYAWLKRLSHWNSGACLADDMGLGKTIQALALLVDRAFDGPQLVVAPASVGFNWESEARRFAPTLTPKQFRDCDRDQFFDDIQPGDLVITSYGLLQSEIERFETVPWQTVLLDEAQAIKNMATKRSQAVMQLDAGFKVILTGTPMENHLGELWNLFRFIVPGLLGSQEEFRQRFAAPIEKDNCRATRNRLKRLIQPFLLRRTKSEVLTELPPRSESVLEVELSPAEVALYEALRRQALQKIAEAAESTSQGKKHLQVLAELTRLRLACCHPKLVGGDGISGSKLAVFREKIEEIVDGNHKVLVFSQFVKHLEILREELDDMGVSYQYLDGSTSVKKRKLAVDSFQSGQGDVFLISLKAGGTGLNLTAADYVIHMDPWWNPAVEDQATDRVHRIGQQRPVNVYRLIARGTIEEKIVDLHNTKRDLADSLLEGSDSAGKLTIEQLIGLLKDQPLEPVG